jgi:choline dehydrogenase-like flavoprotein
MLEHLSPSQHRTVAAMAEAIAPPCAHLPIDAQQAGVADALDDLLGLCEPSSRRRIGLLATAMRLAPLAAGQWRTFAALPRPRREAYLRRALSGRRWDHDVAMTLRTLCEMLYAGEPRFREHVGDFNEPFKQGVPVPAETPLPVIQYPELGSGATLDCDVVIVGSGAGGATIARELAQAGIEVVLVEEGGPVERADFDGRVLHRIVKYYRDNGFTATLGGSVIPVPMGRVVGGTTVVNSGTCLRAPESLLDEWATEHGAELASPEAMGPPYDALAERLNIQPVADDVMGNNGIVVRRGAEELGLHSHPIPRPVRGCAGTGQCGFGCPRDAKQAMHLTHLPQAVERGARIYARCEVDRLLMKGARATGVSARIRDANGRPTGHILTVRAKAVFLCAGALITPVLLRRHGLGRSGGAVGRHLRIHPGSGITGRFSEVINGWQGVMQSYAIDEKLHEGILLEATFPPLGMSYSAGSLPGIGDEHAKLLSEYPHMASIGSIVSDTGSGTVRDLPVLGPTMLYRMSAEDVRRTIRATALAARVLFAAGAREVYPGLPALPVLRSPAEADALEQRSFTARDVKVSAYHPMGTARMGRDPSRSACDPSGRVHEAENVYVADTSLFPGSTHVNPQYTLMALCLNIAQRFLDAWPAGARRP